MNECYTTIHSLETTKYIQEILITDFVLHTYSMAHITEKSDCKNAVHIISGRC